MTEESEGGSFKLISSVVSTIGGQLPWILNALGVHSISIYQPAIYEGKQLFLIVPIGVGIFATWLVVIRSANMAWVFAAFVLLAILVYWLHGFPTMSPVHPANWILSYCLPALVFPMIVRLVIDTWRPSGTANPRL
jgi:hypothetical protein